MKTLIYTTCDFSPQSYECTELLYRSITLNNSNFDFAIISDKEHPNSAFPIIKVDNTTGHLSNWKYSHLIPNGYNQYFYLDSDILFFGKLENLYNEHELSICSGKDAKMSDSEYYCYKYATPEEKLEMKKYEGFCAGSFGFKNIDFLSEMRNLMIPKQENAIIPDDISRREMFLKILPDAILDQTSFNYWIFKRLPEFKYFDFSNQCIIRPDGMRYTSDKTVYHFCGFQMEMSSKYQRMLHFCHNNNIEI